MWAGLNKGWGFTVRTSEDGLRLRYGLTETTSQTIPPGRVQVRRHLVQQQHGREAARGGDHGSGIGGPGIRCCMRCSNCRASHSTAPSCPPSAVA